MEGGRVCSEEKALGGEGVEERGRVREGAVGMGLLASIVLKE